MLQKNKKLQQDSFGANFKFKLLSVLQNSSQAGSTLAVGIGLGALMIGATGLAIATSSQNKTNVASNEQSAQAVAAAEAGVARIQAFLAANPKLAIYDGNDWKEVENGNIPTSTDEEVSIFDRNVIISDVMIGGIASASNETIVAQFADGILIAKSHKDNGNNGNNKDSEEDSEDVSDGGTTACVPLKSSETEITKEFTQEEVDEIQAKLGQEFDNSIFEKQSVVKDKDDAQFKLIAYQFNESNETGTLTVEGEYNDSSRARLEVKFTVEGNSGEDVTPLPDDFPEAAGLWAQQFSISGGGNQTINFDILDSSGCDKANGVAWSEPSSGAFKHNGDHIQFNNYFPPLPGPLNDEGKFNIPSSISTISGCSPTENASSYKYIGGCNSSMKIDISDGKNVAIYSDVAVPTVSVTGLDKNPGKVIVYSNNGLNFGSDGKIDNADQWKHIQYYVASGNVTSSGNLTSSGFIFAPNSEFRINGGGSGTHTGPIWARRIDIGGGGGSTMNPSLSRADFEYLEVFETPTPYRVYPPQEYIRIPVK